jgi:hypothetical protein
MRMGGRAPNATSALSVMSPSALGRLISAFTIRIGSDWSMRSSSATGIGTLRSCAKAGHDSASARSAS